MIIQTQLMDLLRQIASALKVPVMIFLLILGAGVVFMLGTLIAEGLGEQLRLKAKLPQLMEKLQGAADLNAVISACGLLKRQKALFWELTSHPDMTVETREALARRMLFREEARYAGITQITDLMARLGPMMGLLGTLIPLGPGLIALGQGDTYTLANSLLTAFDTTIMGLAVASVAFIISAVRKSWYEDTMSATEAVAECLLNILNKEGLEK